MHCLDCRAEFRNVAWSTTMALVHWPMPIIPTQLAIVKHEWSHQRNPIRNSRNCNTISSRPFTWNHKFNFAATVSSWSFTCNALTGGMLLEFTTKLCAIRCRIDEWMDTHTHIHKHALTHAWCLWWKSQKNSWYFQDNLPIFHTRP